MMNHSIKRKIAAVLCAAILLGQAAPVVPALHGTAYAEEEQTEKVFSGASASGSNASSETASDGSISGSATFTGSTVVAKLYKGGSQVSEKTLPDGGGSFTFSGLSAGDYVVRYFFWGEGGTVLDQNSVSVGYNVVKEPEETETPEPDETQTPAPDETETPEPDETETPAPNNTQESDGNSNSGQNETMQRLSLARNTETSGITKYTCNKTDETEAEKQDGTISGTVEFAGDTSAVVKLKGTGREVIINSTGGAYLFDNLEVGTYQVDFHTYGQPTAAHSETVEILKGSVPPKITDYTCQSTNETEYGKEDGTITGSVNFDGDLVVVVKLYEEGSSTPKKEVTITSSGGSYQFSDLPAGQYNVAIHLYGHSASKTAEITIDKGVVPNKITDYTCLKTDVSAEGVPNGTISGSVTFMGDTPVKVKLENSDWERTVQNSGDTYEFSGLSVGTYNVNFYIAGHSVSATQTVEIGVAQTAASGQITNYTCEKTDETKAGKNDGVISGKVDFTGGSVVVKLYEDGSSSFKEEINLTSSGEIYTFSGLSAGTYQVAFHMYNQSAADEKTITIGTAPVQAEISDAICLKEDVTKAGEDDGTITGSVTFTGDVPVVVKLYEEGSTTAKEEVVLRSSGESYKFSNLPAGEYRVDFHLYGQGASKTEKVEIGVTAPAITPVSITSVTEGEKTLTVKGTAQAGATIQVETVPATPMDAMGVGSNGVFEWILTVEPNTYTQVKVFYANDTSSGDTETGSWTVTASETAPDIVVDPVDNYSTTVVVKTGAKLAVTLKTSDSTQTLESDANGLVYFSLTHKYLKGEEFTITVVYGSGSGKTVTKKVTVGGAADYQDLEYGDYGEAVLRLTTRLNQLGYPIAPTKDYNSAVREAVRLFQLANGQEADGEAGDRMQAALFSVSAIRYGSGRYPTLVRGDKGLALIKTLQQRLKDLGYYTIKVDGIFGSGTQRAVRLFQQVNGLRVTGIADNATQVLLYSSAAKPIGYGTSGSYQTLQRSSKYKSAVVPLQRRLRELGYYTGSIDGYFGSKTYRAVRNFQSRNGLKVTGVADTLTQQLLYSAAAKKYNGSAAGSSSSTSTGYRLLYWGCRGDAVKQLQNALISAGYKNYVRSADGIFGQWTYDAVCAYQRDHGLTVDGIAGKKTQNSLYGTNY